MILRINSGYFPKQHQPVHLCDGYMLCFLWGKNWIFRYLDEVGLQGFNSFKMRRLLCLAEVRACVQGLSHRRAVVDEAGLLEVLVSLSGAHAWKFNLFACRKRKVWCESCFRLNWRFYVMNYKSFRLLHTNRLRNENVHVIMHRAMHAHSWIVVRVPQPV
jgi:hypothetical protein